MLSYLCARFIPHALAILAFTSLAHADSASCQGRDLIALLKSEDRAAYDQIQAEANATVNGEALLWRIEGRVGAPSYLFGTAHVSDPRITQIPSSARIAFASADIVALELVDVVDRQRMAAATLRNARYVAMPAGKSLWDIVPDGDEALIRGNPNLPEGREAVISAYQPWVVATMLSIPLCEQRRIASGELALDEYLAKTAVAQGKKLVGLETVEEQLAIFSSMPLDQQVEFLLATARLGKKTEDYFETLINQYLQRRLTTLLPLSRYMDTTTGGDGMSVAFMEGLLIAERNFRMHAAALDLLRQGRVFIAVGALHLPGENGLVQLIRNSGFKVTPVD